MHMFNDRNLFRGTNKDFMPNQSESKTYIKNAYMHMFNDRNLFHGTNKDFMPNHSESKTYITSKFSEFSSPAFEICFEGYYL